VARDSRITGGPAGPGAPAGPGPALRACVGCALLALAASACAAAGAFRVPAGPWTPDATAAAAFDEAVAACRSVRSLTAEISVRGRAGGMKVRGRVIAGFQRGGSLRLEAPAPFGAPIFVLAARRDRGTLWMPRAKQVLRDAAVEDVLEALTGLRRSSDEVLSLLCGCPPEAARAGAGGRRHAAGWLEIGLGDGILAYLRQERGAWRFVAARSGGAGGTGAWSVSYSGFASRLPAAVSIRQEARSDGQLGPVADLTFVVSAPDVNAPIDDAAFDLAVPRGAQPVTIEDLRQAGPLADRGRGERSGR